MHTQTRSISSQDKTSLYAEAAVNLSAIISGESNLIANLANTAAVLFHSLPDLNWAGFYLLDENELVLAPFQGKPACIRIAVGRGVCGTAAQRRETIIVPDVHAFPGHIACDADSRSEIVIPLIRDLKLIGVMDLDSPVVGRFDAEDGKGLEKIAAIVLG